MAWICERWQDLPFYANIVVCYMLRRFHACKSIVGSFAFLRNVRHYFFRADKLILTNVSKIVNFPLLHLCKVSYSVMFFSKPIKTTNLQVSGRYPESLHQVLLIFTHQIWPPPVRSFQLPHLDRWEGRARSSLPRRVLGTRRCLIGLAVKTARGACVVRTRRWLWAGITVAVLRTWNLYA